MLYTLHTYYTYFVPFLKIHFVIMYVYMYMDYDMYSKQTLQLLLYLIRLHCLFSSLTEQEGQDIHVYVHACVLAMFIIYIL